MNVALSSHRILLIDDEPDILTILSLTLKTLGNYEIETCASGQTALEIAPAFLPDTIFLDVMMPGMDGMETLAALRSRTETASVPIVIMTAKSGAAESEQYRRAGAAAVLSKPFQKEDLTQTMLSVRQPAPPIAAAAIDSAPTTSRFDKVAAQYVEKLPAKMSEIEAAWGTLQGSETPVAAAAALRDLAHKLAGTAGSYGLGKLSAAAAALEHKLDEHPANERSVSPGAHASIKALVERLVSESRQRGN